MSAPLDHRIARYEFASSDPRTPCTDGRWQAGAYVQCDGPRLYEVRWRRLIGAAGGSEGRYVPDRALLCEPHARAFCTRRGLYMPGEEPKEAPTLVAATSGAVGSPQRPGNGEGGIRPLGQTVPASGTACEACYPAWADHPAGTVHVPAPGGCPHRCHASVPA